MTFTGQNDISLKNNAIIGVFVCLFFGHLKKQKKLEKQQNQWHNIGQLSRWPMPIKKRRQKTHFHMTSRYFSFDFLPSIDE